MRKEGIAVYSPSNAIEIAVQEASHKYLGEWVNSHVCQLVAKSINSLKVFDDWLENASLLEQRVSYFFVPHMSARKDEMVFVTHLLYLRDIIENEEINIYNHDPIVLMTIPIAHYLFREYPIHIHIDINKLKSLNYRAKWIEVGGLIISETSVRIDESAIISIQNFAHDDMDIKKVAASWIGPDIFAIDEHESTLEPNAGVWDKKSRESARVVKVEPGETGEITIRYMNGIDKTIPKPEFDMCFVRVGPQSGNDNFDAEYNKNMEAPVND